MDKKERTCNRCRSKDIKREEGPFTIPTGLKTIHVAGTLYKCLKCGNFLTEEEPMASLLPEALAEM